MVDKTTTVKSNELYIFELQEEILNSLELMIFDSSVTEVTIDKQTDSKSAVNEAEDDTPGLLGCRSCEIGFSSPVSRKLHYKTDYHRFNIKRKINGLPPISLEEFEVLAENDDVESISGSDSNSDSDSEGDIYREDKDKLSAILEDQVAEMKISEDSLAGPESHLNTRSPQIYFKSKILDKNEIFGAYKALFSKVAIERPLESIREWNLTVSSASNHDIPYSALFMVGGGHFAGAIVSHKRLNIKGHMTKNDETLQERAVQFLEHKTFHRYTTRRKQGGSQSAMDNSKGKANSAGSSLRRYNETALRVDIQQLLYHWTPYLKHCKNIFIRAKSTSDRRMFLDSSTCLDKNDMRIRSFPFTTKRPTGHELKKAWCQLAYLHVNEKPQADAKLKSNADEIITVATPAKVQPQVEEDPNVLHTRELISLLKKSKAPLLLSYLRKTELDKNFRFHPQQEYAQTPTMLHYAAQQGLKNMVLILLSNLKCDPTIKNAFGRTPWELSKKKEVQQSFQIARFNLGEDFTDWESSRIGEPVSREEIEALNEKEDKERELEKARLIREELSAAKEKQRLEKESKRGPGKTLVPLISSLQQTTNSLTDDQRMRLMREQRARAAEARMKSNSG
ncbi:LANO_0F13058g1_1 [Lachancea nothofagi CBS 11611]|uniref:LANO_0F13058g1_1 n=1 Tax=Lachancea nothofagi CBS 11611 TaxID=1266666 RepID=A0A1G4KBK9_9SACH|nr:LANO_0F13058g1_1 [Lachancea nothofagi CBS 11611]